MFLWSAHAPTGVHRFPYRWGTSYAHPLSWKSDSLRRSLPSACLSPGRDRPLLDRLHLYLHRGGQRRAVCTERPSEAGSRHSADQSLEPSARPLPTQSRGLLGALALAQDCWLTAAGCVLRGIRSSDLYCAAGEPVRVRCLVRLPLDVTGSAQDECRRVRRTTWRPAQPATLPRLPSPVPPGTGAGRGPAPSRAAARCQGRGRPRVAACA